MRARRTVAIAGTALALVVTLGAEEGGCSSKKGNATGGKVDNHGNQPDGKCHHTATRPVIEGRKIVARVDTVCDEPVERHKLTVTLMKRDQGAKEYSSVNSGEFDRSPALRATKVAKLRSACHPGVYRTSFQVDILMLDATAWDTGGATILQDTVVTRKDCA